MMPVAALPPAFFALAALAATPAWSAEEPRTARPSLTSTAQPLWSDLSPAQRELLAPLEPQWNALPATKKTGWLAFAARFAAMKPEDQQRARDRIREWAALTPDQRRVARANFRLAEPLARDERVVTWQQYQTLTPEQREVLRQAGTTSNTAAGHAGSSTGLAKQAARPLGEIVRPSADTRSSPSGGAASAETPPTAR